MHKSALLVLLTCVASGCSDATARRRDAIAQLRADLQSFARAESAFVADSGHPTRTLPPGYGFVRRKGTAGPRVEIMEYGWRALIQDSRTSMTCQLVAMLDRTSGTYTPGQPSCSAEDRENIPVVHHPEPGPPAYVTPITVIRDSSPRRAHDWGAVNNEPPPIPYIARNTCQSEGCTTSGTWVACSTVVARDDTRPAAAPVFTIQPGETFLALTADVHVDEPGLVVFRRNYWTIWGDGERPVDTIRFTPADTLYVLNELGEGRLMWWFRGQAIEAHQIWPYNPDENGNPLLSDPSDTVAQVRLTKTIDWVRVRSPAGQEGWIVRDSRKMATGGYMDEIERCLHPAKR